MAAELHRHPGRQGIAVRLRGLPYARGIANSRATTPRRRPRSCRDEHWAQGSQPLRPPAAAWPQHRRAERAQTAIGQYISTINLSGKGRAFLRAEDRSAADRQGDAGLIITEYDLPRKEAMPHDAQMDVRGNVWYGDFGSQYIGWLDPKTGKTTEFSVPIWKPGAPTGISTFRFDRNGLVWVGNMMQGSLVMFDPKTESSSPGARRNS